MSSLRRVLAASAALGLAVLLCAGGCGGAASSTCAGACDKAEACGDIDAVKADQCRAKCDANAAQSEADLDKCINKADIVTAANQCLSRACSDYVACGFTLPACKQ